MNATTRRKTPGLRADGTYAECTCEHAIDRHAIHHPGLKRPCREDGCACAHYTPAWREGDGLPDSPLDLFLDEGGDLLHRDCAEELQRKGGVIVAAADEGDLADARWDQAEPGDKRGVDPQCHECGESLTERP